MFVPLSVLEFRDRAAAFYAGKLGVIDGERRFTYGQFAERTHRLANVLRDIGVGHGDRVSFLTYNTHQLLEAYYGVIEAGAVLNPINIRLAPHDIAYIVGHARSRVLVYHQDFTPLVEQIRNELAASPMLVVLEGEAGGLATHEYEGLIAAGSPEPHPAEIDENAVAELFYTSGTTGRPKGVALTHRTLHLHGLDSTVALRFTEDDVVLHVVPLFHVNGWGTPHSVTLSGARHVMLRRFDPVTLLSLVEQHRVTYLLGVPTIFNAVLHHPERRRFDLSSLRQIIIGGAPASPALVRSLEEELRVSTVAGYGLTETAPVLSIAWPRRHVTESEPPERRIERQAMTGWAIPGATLRVVAQDGSDVRPDGQQIGEIVVHSNHVMEAYEQEPEETAIAMGDGWLRTGDMATIDELGYISIRDRAKDVIISGGENISSVEIENALAAHPAVFESAVVAAPDDTWGEIPVALVVLKPDMSATADELVAYCRGHLAGFKVPRRIEFRDQLPKGGTGKILKGELREPFWAGEEKRVH
jgi:fatty-acyl-CoA synthase